MDSISKFIKMRIKRLSGHYLRRCIYKYARQESLSKDETTRLMDWVNHSYVRKELFDSLSQALSELHDIDKLTKEELIAKFGATEETAVNENSSDGAWIVRLVAKAKLKKDINNFMQQLILLQVVARTIEIIVRPIVYLIVVFLLIAVVLQVTKK